MSYSPPTFTVVTNDQGRVLNPSVHSELDAGGLDVYEFAVLAHAAYCCRRAKGEDTTSHATAARDCCMSLSAVRRARGSLVERGLLVVSAAQPGRPTAYALGESMAWNRGCKLWLPQEVWNQCLSPQALRVYCHYVSKARGSASTLSDRTSTARQCCMETPTLRKAEAELVSAGMLSFTGRSRKRPVFAFTTSSSWVAPPDRQPMSYADILRTHEKETSEQGVERTKKKRQSRVPAVKENSEQGEPQKKKRQSTKSNADKNTDNGKRSFADEGEHENATQVFTDLLGRTNLPGFVRYLGRDGDADQQLEGWLKTFGVKTLQRAWGIIQDTTTNIDVNPVYGHPKNSRLINFCRGKFDASDPVPLTALHSNAVHPQERYTPPLPVNSPTPFDYQPRSERLRQRFQVAKAQERAAA